MLRLLDIVYKTFSVKYDNLLIQQNRYIINAFFHFLFLFLSFYKKFVLVHSGADFFVSEILLSTVIMFAMKNNYRTGEALRCNEL